jgi:deoxyinosine 3'endonuclease (endonuclease V)
MPASSFKKEITRRLKYEDLLMDNLSIQEATRIQEESVKKLKKGKKRDPPLKEWRQVRFVAGVDISYVTLKGQERGFACALLWDLTEGSPREKRFAEGTINFPYEALIA